MKNKLCDIKNVSVLFVRTDTFLDKFKIRVKIYKTVRQINKPLLILCTGKYAVHTGEKLFNHMYKKIDLAKIQYVQYISYLSGSTNTVQQDINRFIHRMKV